jgi:tetratricopeptide (TPR) repeat protein
LSDRGRLSEAIDDIEISIEKCRSLSRLDRDGADPILAAALANRGLLYLDTGKYGDALADFEEACRIHVSLRERGRNDLRAKFAGLRATRAVALDEAECDVDVLGAFAEAIGDLQELAEAGREDVDSYLALALMNRADSHLRRNNAELSIQDGKRALAMFRRSDREERRASSRAGHVLTILAEACFRQGRFDESHDFRHQGLAFLEELMASGVACQPVLIRKTAQAAIYLAAHDLEEAVALLGRAVAIAEQAIADAEAKEALAIELERICRQLDRAASLFASSPTGCAELSRMVALAKRAGNRVEACDRAPLV